MDDPGGNQQARVALMIDRRLFRDVLVESLATRLTVVGHAGNTEDLLMLCALHSPDVALVADCGDAQAARAAVMAVRQRYPQIHVVMVYEQMSPEDLSVLWRAGVDTLMPVSHGLEALLVLLRRAAAAGSGAKSDNGLTDREREILALVGAGHTVCRIATLLQTSVHEVENAKRRIYRKLDVASHSQAVARAAALGMLDRPSLLPTRAVRNVGVPLAILCGPDSPTRKLAVTALLAHGVQFSLDPRAAGEQQPGSPGGEQWQRGVPVLVLVEPRPQDWPSPDAARSPVVLVCAGGAAQVDVLDSLGRGLAAVISAERVVEDLVPAMTLAARGYLALDADRMRKLLTGRLGRDAGLPALTARESEILDSIAAGHTVRQTARALGIAVKTVENTQARLFRKLRAHNRAAALAAAHEWGLIGADGATAGASRPVLRPHLGRRRA